MHRLILLLLAAAAAPAYAQPIFIPEPGHPAEDAYPPPPRGDALPPRRGASPAYGLLQPQNAVRAGVGEAPLQWSPQLAAAAQQWADYLIESGQFRHWPGDRYGENLYAITGGVATPGEVVTAWAGEARDYDLRSNACSSVCGHYTQIVWRSTRNVGCAVASGGARQVWVCEYDPPGNVVGFRPF